jgi:hypothetical protein
VVYLVDDQQAVRREVTPGHGRRVVGHHRDRPRAAFSAADDAHLILRHAGLGHQPRPPLLEQVDRRHHDQGAHRHLLQGHEGDHRLTGASRQDDHAAAVAGQPAAQGVPLVRPGLQRQPGRKGQREVIEQPFVELGQGRGQRIEHGVVFEDVGLGGAEAGEEGG